ncbi:MAG: hypothetical protein GT601_05815 [Acidaminobacter sp.]|uniref:Rha family transcriptional regulator n=1 Tax=Acidaminobacter sp. TaxID=1872102 RepID=UPI0013812D2B|nr:Rha family transcriptional regulator [Acidaminobacter sp.]MZQ97172.1 hypothetical protein [Acidaminobacter sp.]
MNELIRIENGEVKADSRMVAEHFGKRHDAVMRDIRDEQEKLPEEDRHIFVEIYYEDAYNRKQPAYEMTEEGLMQLAARYDAVSRRKLIVKIKELKAQNQQKQPQSQAEFIFMMAQQALEQERKLTEIQGTVQVIKDAMVPIEDDWRLEIKRMINRIALKLGGGQNEHLKIRHESYETLEKKAHANLEIRVENLQNRLMRNGASKTAIRTANKLDVIEQDPKLKEIYTGIIRQMVIKYCEGV